jgi:hypothetical protein
MAFMHYAMEIMYDGEGKTMYSELKIKSNV